MYLRNNPTQRVDWNHIGIIEHSCDVQRFYDMINKERPDKKIVVRQACLMENLGGKDLLYPDTSVIKLMTNTRDYYCL